MSATCLENPEQINLPDCSSLCSCALFAESKILECSEISESSSNDSESACSAENDTSFIENTKQNDFEVETASNSCFESSPKFAENRFTKMTPKIHQWTEEEDNLIISLYESYGEN